MQLRFGIPDADDASLILVSLSSGFTMSALESMLQESQRLAAANKAGGCLGEWVPPRRIQCSSGRFLSSGYLGICKNRHCLNPRQAGSRYFVTLLSKCRK